MIETLADLKQLVCEHPDAFQSTVQESVAAIELAEQTLGVSFPEAMTWLLTTHGYSSACGIDSLSQAVEATLRCREKLKLPHHIIVLNDWNDAGVVYLDANSSNGCEKPVYWAGAHNFLRLAEGTKMDADIDRFPSFSAWVEDRLRETEEE